LSFAGHQQADPYQRVRRRAHISSAAQCQPFCILLPQHGNAFAVCLRLQVTSKLILINAFVDAHTSAQQLINRHLAQLTAAQAADDESSSLNNNNSSSSCRTGNTPAGAAAYDADRVGGPAKPDAAVGGGAESSSKQQLQMQGAEQQEGEPCGELDAACLVLQESQNEVTAALQYAQEVGAEGCDVVGADDAL
jgi:hypothetical protein